MHETVCGGLVDGTIYYQVVPEQTSRELSSPVDGVI
jgi:hypothetical protein